MCFLNLFYITNYNKFLLKFLHIYVRINYFYSETILNNKFRAVRILNAGFNDKKILIALLIKEFLNSK